MMMELTRNGIPFDQIVDIGNPSDADVKMTIISAKLNRGPYYFTLDLKYELETPSEIREFYLPAVRLPINEERFWIGMHKPTIFNGHRCDNCTVDVGFGLAELDVDCNGHAYYERIVKTKTKEMTLDEIEKKLGHKVKIVNKK